MVDDLMVARVPPPKKKKGLRNFYGPGLLRPALPFGRREKKKCPFSSPPLLFLLPRLGSSSPFFPSISHCPFRPLVPHRFTRDRTMPPTTRSGATSPPYPEMMAPKTPEPKHVDLNGHVFELPTFTMKEIHDAIPAHCFKPSAGEGPGLVVVVRHRCVGMLEEGDRNCR